MQAETAEKLPDRKGVGEYRQWSSRVKDYISVSVYVRGSLKEEDALQSEKFLFF